MTLCSLFQTIIVIHKTYVHVFSCYFPTFHVLWIYFDISLLFHILRRVIVLILLK